MATFVTAGAAIALRLLVATVLVTAAATAAATEEQENKIYRYTSFSSMDVRAHTMGIPEAYTCKCSAYYDYRKPKVRCDCLSMGGVTAQKACNCGYNADKTKIYCQCEGKKGLRFADSRSDEEREAGVVMGGNMTDGGSASYHETEQRIGGRFADDADSGAALRRQAERDTLQLDGELDFEE